MTTRYVRPKLGNGCDLCGSMSVSAGRVCDATTCAACGTRQCMSNGFGRGQCSVCYVGLLPGWSGFDQRVCGYKHCGRPAIASAERVHFVCSEHLERTKVAAGSVASAGANLESKEYGRPKWRAVDDSAYRFQERTDNRLERAARYAEYAREIGAGLETASARY